MAAKKEHMMNQNMVNTTPEVPSTTMSYHDIKGSLAYKLADVAYTAYCKHVGGVSYDNKPLPTWEEFYEDATKRKQSEAWIESAHATINYINNLVLQNAER